MKLPLFRMPLVVGQTARGGTHILKVKTTAPDGFAYQEARWAFRAGFRAVAGCFYKALGALKEATVSPLTPILNNNAIFERRAAWRVYPEFPVFVFRPADESPSNHSFHPVLCKVISNLVDLKIDCHVAPDCTARSLRMRSAAQSVLYVSSSPVCSTRNTVHIKILPALPRRKPLKKSSAINFSLVPTVTHDQQKEARRSRSQIPGAWRQAGMWPDDPIAQSLKRIQWLDESQSSIHCKSCGINQTVSAVALFNGFKARVVLPRRAGTRDRCGALRFLTGRSKRARKEGGRGRGFARPRLSWEVFSGPSLFERFGLGWLWSVTLLRPNQPAPPPVRCRLTEGLGS